MHISKPVSEIAEDDVCRLIKADAPEDQTLEFKLELHVDTVERKKELFRDVSAFANEAGGDILFGIRIDNGIPQLPLCPLVGFDSDKTPLQLRDLCRAHIDPPIHDLSFHPIALGSGGHILLVRVPASWERPHMVKHDDHRFYKRDGPGKRLMSTQELRDVFTLSAATADRMRLFRAQRIDGITRKQIFIPLHGSTCVVLHVFPLSAFEKRQSLNMQSANDKWRLLEPMSWEDYGSTGRRYNFDGFLTTAGERARVASYVQVFRNGCIEAVDSRAFDTPSDQKVIIPTYEQTVGKSLKQYLSFLNTEGIQPPIFVMLSLLRVAGYRMFRESGILHRPVVENSIQHPDLIIPEIQIDSYATSYFENLKETFDVVWQACGYPADPNFDANGKWNYKF